MSCSPRASCRCSPISRARAARPRAAQLAGAALCLVRDLRRASARPHRGPAPGRRHFSDGSARARWRSASSCRPSSTFMPSRRSCSLQAPRTRAHKCADGAQLADEVERHAGCEGRLLGGDLELCDHRPARLRARRQGPRRAAHRTDPLSCICRPLDPAPCSNAPRSMSSSSGAPRCPCCRNVSATSTFLTNVVRSDRGTALGHLSRVSACRPHRRHRLLTP